MTEKRSSHFSRKKNTVTPSVAGPGDSNPSDATVRRRPTSSSHHLGGKHAPPLSAAVDIITA